MALALFLTILPFLLYYITIFEYQHNLPMNPRPPFMNGLITARGILVSLKQRKLRDQKERWKQPKDQNNQQIIENQPKIDKSIIPQPPQQMPYIAKPSKRQELTQSINKIGKDLHAIHEENQTYEIIFNQLVEYYQQNHKIVEDNERYKRRGFQFQEKITEFKEKIKENYDRIQENERQGAQIHTLLQKYLQEFIRAEKERALVDPYKVHPMKATELLKGEKVNEKQKEGKLEQGDGNQNATINLNWRSLSQKTAKKAVVRKTKVNNDDIRETLFTSELYNI